MIKILSIPSSEIFVISLILMVILIISLGFEKSLKKEQKKYLFMAMLCEVVSLFTTLLALPMEGVAEHISELKILYSFTYVSNELMCLTFTIYLVSMLREHTFISDVPTYVVAFVSLFTAMICVQSLYSTGYISFVDAEGTFVKGKLFLASILVPAIIMFFDAALTISCYRYIDKKQIESIMTFFVFPLIAVGVNTFSELDFTAPACALGFLCIFINVCSETRRRDAMQKTEMAESRLRLMISQMQPHFMYNSLNAIYYLIGKDKEKAKEALETFGDYLQNNLDNLQTDKPVPIEEEINHVKAYLYLEQLRFDEDLKVLYDVDSTGYFIPPLTIQPLVENAVKHGIAQNARGGIVRISVKEVGLHCEVTVSDNGVGFEVDNPTNNTSMESGLKSTHVGLTNVRSRIEEILDGTMEIYSELGKGTTIKILIPSKWKKGEQDENLMC